MSTDCDTTRSTLPQEVIYIVIDQLHDDKPSLSAFSLASGSFFEHARSALFASITFRPNPSGKYIGGQDLLHFLRDTDHAAQYIHHLFIDGRHQQRLTRSLPRVGELLHIVALTTSLRSLRLRCIRIGSNSGFATDGLDLPLPALQELTLEQLFYETNVPFSVPVNYLSSLLSYFPSLSTFTIRWIVLYREPNQTLQGFSTSKLRKLQIHTVTESELLLPLLSGLETLSLYRVPIASATAFINRVSPRVKNLQLRAIFSQSDSDVPHFSVLTTCRSLLTYTAVSQLSNGVYRREEAWRALTGPLPFLPPTLRHFVFVFVSGASMDVVMSEAIAALEDQAGWDEQVQERFLALARLETVEIELDHDFEDKRNEHNVMYMKGCQAQVKRIIKRKLGRLDERGLLRFKSSLFGIYEEW